jgi:alpha-tubulin suppressor-like RCC1 family protein
MWCNSRCQVGRGDHGLRTARDVPTVVPAVNSTVVIVAAGTWHPFALSSYDTAFEPGCGNNQLGTTENGELGNGETDDRDVCAAAVR